MIFKKTNKVTLILIIINFIVFFLEKFVFPIQFLFIVSEFSNSSNILYKFSWYFISAFSHVNLIHISLNMYFLYYFGPLVEEKIKSKIFLIYYIVSVILSGIILDLISNSISIGASGVLYAMIGTVYFWKLNNFLVQNINRKSLEILILINVIFSIVIPNVSVLGHLSGFMSGMIFGYFYMKIQRNKWKRNIYELNLKNK